MPVGHGRPAKKRAIAGWPPAERPWRPGDEARHNRVLGADGRYSCPWHLGRRHQGGSVPGIISVAFGIIDELTAEQGLVTSQDVLVLRDVAGGPATGRPRG